MDDMKVMYQRNMVLIKFSTLLEIFMKCSP